MEFAFVMNANVDNVIGMEELILEEDDVNTHKL